jgi:hypothetical protein
MAACHLVGSHGLAGWRDAADRFTRTIGGVCSRLVQRALAAADAQSVGPHHQPRAL